MSIFNKIEGVIKKVEKVGVLEQKQQPINEAPAKEALPPKTLTFTLSKGFKGFNKFHMTVYGNNEVEKNNTKFIDSLSGKTITFVSDHNNEKRFYKVYIDNLQVGSIFEDIQINALDNEYIEKVYAKVEEKTGLNKEGKPIKEKRIYLFVKYIDKE